jgi:hypothetical protein
MERCGLGRERDQASLDRQKCVVKCAAGQPCNALIQIAFRRCVDRPASAIRAHLRLDWRSELPGLFDQA